MMHAMRKRLRDLRRESSGQALVEFAIVAPLIVIILLFAIWFYELIEVKLKVQEAARYAAWEATAYPLHDYAKGPSENSKLAQAMQTAVMQDTIARFSDLDSSTDVASLNNHIFAASWTPPLVYVTNQQEEQIYGGPIVNLIFSIAGTIFDFFSALSYESPNPVALSLIGTGKADMGGAMKTRMFGHSSWGFNHSGYAEARVALLLTNNFTGRGIGKLIVRNDPFSSKTGVLITEKHGVLADSWRLDTGDSVYGNQTRPGYVQNAAYYKQLERMYLVGPTSRSVAKGWINGFKALMLAALAFTGNMATPPNLSDEDFTRPAVVSRSYTDLTTGKVTIVQDRGSTRDYDTAPVGVKDGDGGANLQEYRKTLEGRGPNFMGCEREMSLGCPSSTLQQDNPFGDYVVRE